MKQAGTFSGFLLVVLAHEAGFAFTFYRSCYMKILSEIKPMMSKYGYKKNGNSFWKNENGFYKLINFQKGAYGNYFFINVGLHPNGLPMLYPEQAHLKRT